MPKLDNPKHELFCKLMVAYGGDKVRAYTEAGYKARVGSSGSRYVDQLLLRPEIHARYNEIFAENAAKQHPEIENLTQFVVDHLVELMKSDDYRTTNAKVQAGRVILNFTGSDSDGRRVATMEERNRIEREKMQIQREMLKEAQRGGQIVILQSEGGLPKPPRVDPDKVIPASEIDQDYAN